MEEFNPNPNQPAAAPPAPRAVSEDKEGEPVLRGMPKNNGVWLAVKGILIPVFLIVVVVGSFWLSFNIGKRIWLPLKNESCKQIEANIPETPASIAGLQSKTAVSSEALQAKLAAALKKATPSAAPAMLALPMKKHPALPAKLAVKKRPASPVVVSKKKTTAKTGLATAKYYKVQAGLYGSKANASAWVKKLHSAGFESFIRQVTGGWRVQVGAFKIKSQASKLQRQLKAKGFTSIIVHE